MANHACAYLELAWLNTLRGVAFDVDNVYVKLHVGSPGNAAALNAAQETTRKLVTFSAASGGSMASSADVTWATVTASETFTHLSLWDAETVGNPLYQGPLAESKAVIAGGPFTMSAGDITLGID